MGKMFVRRLKGTITGDVVNRMPVMTKCLGLVKQPEMGNFIARLEAYGFEMTADQLSAVKNFYESGTKNGWLKKILYALPFVGDIETPDAAMVPMVDRFHNYYRLKVGVSSVGTDVTTFYKPFLVLDSHRNVLGIRNYTPERCLVTELNGYDVFAKTPDSRFANNGNFGLSIFGEMSDFEVETTARLTGIGADATANCFIGHNANNMFEQQVMGREVKNENVGKLFSQRGLKYYGNHVTDDGKNIIKYSVYNSDMTELLLKNETAERPSVTSLSTSMLRSYWGLCASWNEQLKRVTHNNLDSKVELRYIAWTDGTLDYNDERTYTTALQEFLAAFNKFGKEEDR